MPVYLLNIEESASLQDAQNSLGVLGDLTTPHPRLPRLMALDTGTEEMIEMLFANVYVHSVCDCEAPVNLPEVQDLVEQPLDADQWALAHISGGDGVYQYDSNEAGQGVAIYIVDTTVDVTLSEWEGRAQTIFGDHSTPGFHAAAVGACAAGKDYGAAKKADLFFAAGFNADGTGATTARLNAALNAVADHIEDNPRDLPAVVNCSWSASGLIFNNPFSAAIGRLWDLGAIIVSSTGNGGSDQIGDNITGLFTKSWPALDNRVIASGAHDQNNQITPWSNYPADYYAPGLSVTTQNAAGVKIKASGTSFSAPLQAGSAACYASAGYPTRELVMQEMMLDSIIDGVGGVAAGDNDRLFKPLDIGAGIRPPVEEEPPTDPVPVLDPMGHSGKFYTYDVAANGSFTELVVGDMDKWDFVDIIPRDIDGMLSTSGLDFRVELWAGDPANGGKLLKHDRQWLSDNYDGGSDKSGYGLLLWGRSAASTGSNAVFMRNHRVADAPTAIGPSTAPHNSNSTHTELVVTEENDVVTHIRFFAGGSVINKGRIDIIGYRFQVPEIPAT